MGQDKKHRYFLNISNKTKTFIDLICNNYIYCIKYDTQKLYQNDTVEKKCCKIDFQKLFEINLILLKINFDRLIITLIMNMLGY